MLSSDFVAGHAGFQGVTYGMFFFFTPCPVRTHRGAHHVIPMAYDILGCILDAPDTSVPILFAEGHALLFAHGFLSVIEVILMATLYGGEVLRTRKFFRIASHFQRYPIV